MKELSVLFLRILSYTEQSLNLKIEESPGTLMKKRKVCVLLILIVAVVLAVGWMRTDPEVRCTSAKSDRRKYSRAGDDLSGRTVYGTSESRADL